MKAADKIRLAEWQGWDRCDPGSEYFFPPNGARPSGPQTYHLLGLPKPDQYERDCHELIKHLNGQNYEVDVLFWEEGDATVILKHHGNPNKRYHDEITAENWMHGVCELALKVIGDG